MEFAIGVLAAYMIFAVIWSRHLLSCRQWVNPLCIFNSIHVVLLVAYFAGNEMDLFAFTLKPFHVLVLAVGYVCFNVGAILVSQRRTRLVPEGPAFPMQLAVTTRIARFSLAVLLVSLVSKYTILFNAYGVNILANIIAIRLDYVSGALDYGWANSTAYTASHVLVLMLGVMEGARHIYRQRRSTLAISALAIVANDVTIGGTNWTFSALCLYVLAWAITRERREGFAAVASRGLLIALGASVATLSVLLYLRSEGGIGGNVPFLQVFTYYTGGDIATFGYFIDTPYPSDPPGRFTLGGLYALANSFSGMLGTKFLPSLDETDFVADIGGDYNSNTTIHLASYYADFGMPGVILFSALLGAVSMWTLARARARGSVVRLQMFALLLWVCALSWRGNPAEGRNFWVLLITLPLVHAISSRFWPLRTSSLRHT